MIGGLVLPVHHSYMDKYLILRRGKSKNGERIRSNIKGKSKNLL